MSDALKIISFSLWGQNPKYTIGALRNIELAYDIYPSWTCRIYCGRSVPFDIQRAILKHPNAQLFLMDEPEDWTALFWRFYAAQDADIVICRDADSRLSCREWEAVQEWLASPKAFHIMRDHPYHNYKILGGMWGAKAPILKDIRDLIGGFTRLNKWGSDQDFLAKIVYPRIRHSALIHDPFFYKLPFPSPRRNFEYIGDIFDENDQREPNLWKVLKKIPL